MRGLVVLVLVGLVGLVGCEAKEGPAGPQGPPGPQGLNGFDGEKGDKGDPGDPGVCQCAAAKLPHYIVDATGEDLGIVVGNWIAFDAATGSTYNILSLAPVYFDQPGCTGLPAVRSDSSSRFSSDSTLGTVVKSNGSLVQFTALSYRRSNGACQEVLMGDTFSAFAFVDTKAPNRNLRQEMVRVELR